MARHVATEATAVRRRIGFAMQEVGADEPATGREFRHHAGSALRALPAVAAGRARTLLELLDLDGAADAGLGDYSEEAARAAARAAARHRPPTGEGTDLLYLADARERGRAVTRAGDHKTPAADE